MQGTIQNTLHAPAERADMCTIERQVGCFLDNSAIMAVLNAINIFVIIINQFRQIIYANNTFLSALGLDSYTKLIGKRPGEAVGCIHSEEHESGCGTSEACRGCNAVNLVLKSIKSEQTVSDEIAITYRNRFFELPMNMFENVTPISFCDETFYIISLIDISDAQRRRLLERLFFHDILNTSGALKGLVGMLKEDVPQDIRPEVEFVEAAFKGLVEEIVEHKQILDAENGELEVEKITLFSDEVIESLIKLYQKHDSALNKTIRKNKDSEAVIVKTDYVILKRILGNMIKNALEAAATSGAVEIGCNKSKIKEDGVEFWVWNREYIPRDVQSRIFQRSFSTKGKNRGIGTYSMKLFGERFLNGEVGFETSKEEGTKFYIRLDIEK